MRRTIVALTLILSGAAVAGQGFTITRPGGPTTFVNPTYGGGYTASTPGYGTTFINPSYGGGYTATTPGQGTTFINPTPSFGSGSLYSPPSFNRFRTYP